jgi:hypothetical protein
MVRESQLAVFFHHGKLRHLQPVVLSDPDLAHVRGFAAGASR